MSISAKDVRSELLNRLRYDLVGPETESETIKNKPLQKYLAGILWPMKSSIATFEDESENIQGRDTAKETIESIAPLAKAMNPSAIGLSFLVDKEMPNLLVDVDFGMYEEGSEKEWSRTPFGIKNLEINVTKGLGEKQYIQIPKLDIVNESETIKSIRLEWIVRTYNNCYAVSMFMVNRYTQDTDEHNIDHKCVFQPKIVVKSKSDKSFMVRNAFSNNEKGFQDDDTKTNELLYREEAVYGVGHSIAVNWRGVDKQLKRCGMLETEIIPAHEIPMVIPPKWDKGGTLDMDELGAMTSPEQVRVALQPLLNEYGKWIEERKREIRTITEYKETAIQHMERCQQSLARMENGIKQLDKNKMAFESFIFANRVMASQRVHTLAIEKGISHNEVKEESTWRPFQIAFFLQNIEGVADSTSKDRQIADLLWFPTGGGKTEAYLGLAAFTLGYRRLVKLNGYRNDVGVSVIMRYTLRLLTVQQFQRATAMICACEEIRKESSDVWGENTFRIGLWVGQSSVPNKFEDAKKVISAKADGISKGTRENFVDLSKGTPVQLVSCPWCGTKLIDDKKPKLFLSTYKYRDKKRRINICCPNSDCSFHRKNSNNEGLPVLVTDEEIYRLLPDLVIGTVDKFARMPWQPEIQNLFGKVKGEVKEWGFLSNGGSSIEQGNAKNVSGSLSLINSEPILPPNLIIQDELHLISGPLGTMVGLYETAVDYLSSIKVKGIDVGPKIVASTATIKNAEKQIEGLYTRKAQIFPSPGLSHTDSFFAQQRPVSETPGRLYVGVFAPGKSMKTTQLRVYANMLASVSQMEKDYDSKFLDPYYTLVGYFNSIRELGGAVRLIEDDVPARMNTLEKQFSENNKYQFTKRELERDVPELTSRIDSGKIPELLSRLEQLYYKKGEFTPVDVLLASNMISVGVDVSRLGLMVVNGQPKTTAEYIQSTSRVGRKHPGLIISSYNWARPRDISHYEEFFAYHSALYRYVEPISVTPFASRARDRGLAAVFVSMLRLGELGLTNNSSAGNMEKVNSISNKIMNIFLNRAKKMNLPTDAIENHLRGLIEEWEDDANRSRLNYYKPNAKSESNLLYHIGKAETEGTFKTPNSMRDVETTAGIYIGRD
ncbi:DNA helicase [Virgibacillus phasianinus]|uniref:DNA helicase n=1 Tax=Virgibacillus phasianinus TaxID=2017483 RepID=A0A220U8N2_9BACI|nr:DISARM system helicase DrmA [Virgibacillus phasianinus]ASK64221.1 DNA helicase [Virgibacillus phasianinus]